LVIDKRGKGAAAESSWGLGVVTGFIITAFQERASQATRLKGEEGWGGYSGGWVGFILCGSIWWVQRRLKAAAKLGKDAPQGRGG